MAARLLLLGLLQGGCLAESTLDEADLQCGPRDLTVECCLKKNPGQWEKCTGTPSPAQSGVSEGTKKKLMRAGAAGTAVAVALQPRFNSAELRGVELAADLLAKVEEVIVRCVRRAEKEANDHYFNGESPTREQCAKSKRAGQTWAAYLGERKHLDARLCLQAELKKLIPGRYLLEPRFRLNERIGMWEYLDAETVAQLMSRLDWKALEGTIEPDIVIMDGKSVIIHVYDMKFPCPESNGARWDYYSRGRWAPTSQNELYLQALRVEPLLVSPREGVERHRE